MARKEVTILTLKNGEQVQITLNEGVNARRAKAKGSGAILIPSQKNRMIDVVMIGDIQDKWVDDYSQPALPTPDRLAIDAPPQEDEAGPGYKKFLEAKVKLKQKYGLSE